MDDRQLRHQMLHIPCADELDREVREVILALDPDFDFSSYARVFADTLRLFRGEYPGYQACNTPYHDLSHTLGVLLATARILHAIHLDRRTLSPRTVNLALAAALFHDIGYIQANIDSQGTGARHTKTHVKRSVGFMAGYFKEHGFLEQDAFDTAAMISCTDLGIKISDISFDTEEVRMAGFALASADIAAQMADEAYLEKLSDLYQELEEGGVADFDSEYGLYKETVGFFTFMEFRLRHLLGNVFSLLPAHFLDRYGMRANPYAEYMDKNLGYLAQVLEDSGESYRDQLKRDPVRSAVRPAC